jgi:amidase
MAAAPGGRSMKSPAAHAASSDTLSEYDALGLAELVQRKEISPLELLDVTITRAETAHALFNFLSQKHYDYARATINKGLSRGPLTGVPFLLKDLDCYIAGELTEQGSRYYKGQRAAVTSELVHRYERAGLVVFGKITVPELGLAATTESTATGLTRNPWNPQHIAGGSSGGSAVAVAAGVVPAAHANRCRRIDPNPRILLRFVWSEAKPRSRADGPPTHRGMGRHVNPSRCHSHGAR